MARAYMPMENLRVPMLVLWAAKENMLARIVVALPDHSLHVFGGLCQHLPGTPWAPSSWGYG